MNEPRYRSLVQRLQVVRSAFPAFDQAVFSRVAGGKTVAIVGNARSLSKTSQGPLIDACDIVIRLNTAPGCKPVSHGSRTTWLATSTPIPVARLRQLKPEVVIWMTPKQRWRAIYLTLSLWKISLYPKSWWQALRRKLDGARPSTGMMTIDLMINIGTFAELKLFGFDFFHSGSLSGRNAADPVPHDFARERQLVASLLAADQRISIIPSVAGSQEPHRH